MNNRYRIRRVLRIIAAGAAVVVCWGLFVAIFRLLFDGVEHDSFLSLFVTVACAILLVHCALSFSKIEYHITENALIAKDFFKKDKRYTFSEVVGIGEAKAGPFTYIVMSLEGGKKCNIPPLDNQKEFIQTIRRQLSPG